MAGRALSLIAYHVNMMLPAFDIHVYSDDDELPDEAEELFRAELADSRAPKPMDRADRDQWRFVCVCAVTREGHVLGGVHMDIGPICFGPMATDKLAYIEHAFVRPQYRRQGVATQLLQRAVEVARAADCQHLRCNACWKNPAEIALFRKCGFALTSIDETDRYFVTKPLQGYACSR